MDQRLFRNQYFQHRSSLCHLQKKSKFEGKQIIEVDIIFILLGMFVWRPQDKIQFTLCVRYKPNSGPRLFILYKPFNKILIWRMQ